MKVWIGVDVGKKGALVALFEDNTIKSIDLIDAIKICDFIIDIDNNHEIIDICVEDVHSIYHTSSKSNFTFGFNCGWIHGIIQSLDFTVSKVTPKVWQRYLGVTTHGKLIKHEVAKLILELYPTVQLYNSHKILRDGISDALSIAHYSRNNINANKDNT